ncbi:DUF4317 domain-containing protein [Sporosarcina thermotolerans]|uniref:DUF4317 domain-containing protein n=1 Tax=Sporosarcina thermotolerans TaxID=633404 RepID=A0AAW9A8K1_9BACL|nr:DUF4317 domain-containing protein [Sporosarcina thermotolerans]MDW0116524.1 DUF4317 domain-containing protein [Sporosarcina thermotolerans]WHT48747.1 DUF4317 domain-containing protein [Sporosarcina thermotolerans]
MNKKAIADIRKRFKLDTDLLKITNIYNVYIRQEGNEIYHEVSQPFAMLDREQQELFLDNFKKVLGGKLDAKLFEVKFRPQAEEQEDHTQKLLYDALHADEVADWKEGMQRIAQKMVQDVQYEKDIVITFIRGNYYKPTKRGSEEAEIAARDEVYKNPFILCSMNQTVEPKRSLVFDFNEKEFKSSFVADPIINLTSPIGGFLFPTFTDNAADVNHILYSAGKANKPNYHFIENVLDGEEIMTADEDKIVFEEIVRSVTGNEINTRTLASVYDEIQRMMEVDEEQDEEESVPTLDTKEVTRVLKASGVEDVDTEKVERAFRSVIDDETYELKASHIVPSYTSKSIKIETKVANIAISPQDLRYVRQVEVDGKRCILIEVEEDTVIEGFTIISEELLK